MKQFTDFLLDKDKGYYDISIKGNDFATTKGLDTSILASLLTDGRASESEQPNALFRRGWWGDYFNDIPVGSKLWFAENRPLDTTTRNYVIDYAKQCLQWLTTQGFVDTINVNASINLQSGSITLIISLIKNGNVTERQFEILEST